MLELYLIKIAQIFVLYEEVSHEWKIEKKIGVGNIIGLGVGALSVRASSSPWVQYCADGALCSSYHHLVCILYAPSLLV